MKAEELLATRGVGTLTETPGYSLLSYTPYFWGKGCSLWHHIVGVSSEFSLVRT